MFDEFMRDDRECPSQFGNEEQSGLPIRSQTGTSTSTCALPRCDLQPEGDEQAHDGDGREDRREDADRQRHGEAPDRTGAQPEHDDGGGEAS